MHSTTAPAAQTTTPPGTARRLAAALDRAMQCGQWEQADRLARDAARLTHESSRLTESLARLRLAQGRAETALAVVDSAKSHHGSLRLLRIIALLMLGRHAEAHIELNNWSNQSSAPLEARRLLALLEFEAGDRDAAVASLLRNLDQIEDPCTLALLLLNSIDEKRTEQSVQWTKRLMSATQWSPTSFPPTAFLASLGIDANAVAVLPPTEDHIETLAMEIAAAEHTLPSLVRAQQIEHDEAIADLLERAVKHALPNLVQQSSACECVAKLSVLRDDKEDALHWVRRGLEINPMSASLAMLLNELHDEIQPAVEREVVQTRRKAA